MGCSHLSLTDLQQLYKYIYRSCIHCPCMESLEAPVIVYSAFTSLLDFFYQIQSLWFIYFDGVCDIASILSSKMICTDFYQNLLHLSFQYPQSHVRLFPRTRLFQQHGATEGPSRQFYQQEAGDLWV